MKRTENLWQQMNWPVHCQECVCCVCYCYWVSVLGVGTIKFQNCLWWVFTRISVYYNYPATLYQDVYLQFTVDTSSHDSGQILPWTQSLENSGSFRIMVDGLLLNHWKMIIRGTENYRAWTQLLPLIMQKVVIRVKICVRFTCIFILR